MSNKTNTYKVYRITNNLSGKTYVGRTKNSLNMRWSDHTNRAANGDKRPFYEEIRRDGWKNFTVSLIEEFDSIEESQVSESKWISYFMEQPEGCYNILASSLGETGLDHGTNEEFLAYCNGHTMSEIRDHFNYQAVSSVSHRLTRLGEDRWSTGIAFAHGTDRDLLDRWNETHDLKKLAEEFNYTDNERLIGRLKKLECEVEPTIETVVEYLKENGLKATKKFFGWASDSTIYRRLKKAGINVRELEFER